MINKITQVVDKIDNLIKEQLPESKYQFQLHDLMTDTKHFRGYDEPFHWGSVYKLFVVAEIIKMAEEGLFNMDDEIEIHKSKYVNGNGIGIAKHLSHLNVLTYTDACKMVMAVSDNLCADELLDIVGFERFNNLFAKAGCSNSKLIVNLDTMVKELFEAINTNSKANFFHSNSYFSHFNKTLTRLLTNNYITVQDINKCYRFVFDEYLCEQSRKVFMECVLMPNIHSRIAAYTFFSNFLLRGKTGALGFGIVNNETSAILKKDTNEIVGYFTVMTKANKKRYFQSNDTIGLIGLEIATLYENIYYNN